MTPNSTERLAFAKARALGVDIVIVDFPNFVHVIPAAELKEGSPAFVATPLESLEHAGHYGFLESCRIGARAMAKFYDTPQAIWQLSLHNTDWGGMFINCAASIDVGLYDAYAKWIEEVSAC